MNTIQLDHKTYTAPDQWNEISEQQLCLWMKICAKKSIKDEDALRLATVGFYGLAKDDFLKLSRPLEIQLLYTLAFLFDKKPALTTWVIPEIGNRFLGHRYYGPANRLSNITIREYRYTELLYSAYQIKQSPELLDQLIASLYRSKDSRGNGNDIRVPLTDLGISKRNKYMSGLPDELKAAILFNYQCCRNYIAERYPTIFLSGGAKNSQALPDLQNMIKNVAGGKFGNFVETEATGLYLFLDHLKEELAENEKNKK